MLNQMSDNNMPVALFDETGREHTQQLYAFNSRVLIRQIKFCELKTEISRHNVCCLVCYYVANAFANNIITQHSSKSNAKPPK